MIETQLEIAGCILIALALLHAAFPRKFRWREMLQNVDLLTRQIFYVHTFFIALAVGLTGWLCITGAEQLATTALGRKVALGFAIFWSCRLLVQFFGFSSTLWRGKPFETFIHILFTALWAYLSILFFVTAFSGT